MKEFIYALEDLFLADKLMGTLQTEKYYIGAYQRGYKWKSSGPNDQVPQLLTDIYEAFVTNRAEYYLQYITVKKNEAHKNWLEVIDGQQRLTTISLLFYSFKKLFGFENITKDIVQYERYEGKDGNIFDVVIEYDSKTPEIADKLERDQNLYYMYRAKVCISSFLSLLSENEAKELYDYCRQKVKIIINLEDEMTAAEEIFSNLNDNKVDLTNYYLIKGLLFTKSTRPAHQQKQFVEIQEKRNRIARNWDEIDNWLQNEVHNQLFFHNYKTIGNDEKNIGINSLLNALKPQVSSDASNIPVLRNFYDTLKEKTGKSSDDYALFNCYNANLKTQERAEEKLSDIHLTSKRLKNWYEDNELYNLIGYYICTKGKLDDILHLGISDLKQRLYTHLKTTLQLKGKQIEQLNYEDDRLFLNIMFLALNVFMLKNDTNNIVIDYSQRFDFHSFRTNNWSIEHIYPQNPDCSHADYEEFYDWFLELKFDERNAPLANKIKKKEALTAEELRETVQQNINEHQLGNLALLTSGTNSALQNYIFPKKRKLLLKLISSGSFVPQHTINAVTKLLHNVDEKDPALSFGNNLTEWNQKDIDSNAQWIINTHEQLLRIVNHLTSED